MIRGHEWRPTAHPSEPPLPVLAPPARTALEWPLRRSLGFVAVLAVVTLLLMGVVGNAGDVVDPAVGPVMLVVLLGAGWYGAIDVRHGPNWLASKRWSRWRWVNLDDLTSADVKKPGWLSSSRYSRSNWKVRLRDSDGRRVDVPALAFRDEELTLQTNVALRRAGLATIGDLDVLPRGWFAGTL
jgi:hypothetical protein